MGTTNHVANLMMVLQRWRTTAARLHATAATQQQACQVQAIATSASRLSLARSVMEAQGHLEQSALQQRVSVSLLGVKPGWLCAAGMIFMYR